MCSSDFFKHKHCIFANKYLILNTPNFIQYSKHKIQTVQGNPALTFNTFGFFRLSFYLKTFECEKSNFSQLLLGTVDKQPIGARSYIWFLNLAPISSLASLNLSLTLDWIHPTMTPLFFYNLYVTNNLTKDTVITLKICINKQKRNILPHLPKFYHYGRHAEGVRLST